MYCLAYSSSSTNYQSCPLGTYRATTGVSVAPELPIKTNNNLQPEQCTKCTEAYACTVKGSAIDPSASTLNTDGPKCGAGYFCKAGATTTTPDVMFD